MEDQIYCRSACSQFLMERSPAFSECSERKEKTFIFYTHYWKQKLLTLWCWTLHIYNVHCDAQNTKHQLRLMANYGHSCTVLIYIPVFCRSHHTFSSGAKGLKSVTKEINCIYQHERSIGIQMNSFWTSVSTLDFRRWSVKWHSTLVNCLCQWHI